MEQATWLNDPVQCKIWVGRLNDLIKLKPVRLEFFLHWFVRKPPKSRAPRCNQRGGSKLLVP